MSATLKAQLRVWAWGLLVAVVSAIANAGVLALGNTSFVEDHWREMLPMLGLAAAREVFYYLKRSPLPEMHAQREAIEE